MINSLQNSLGWIDDQQHRQSQPHQRDGVSPPPVVLDARQNHQHHSAQRRPHHLSRKVVSRIAVCFAGPVERGAKDHHQPDEQQRHYDDDQRIV
jgi:hypothetical protein